MRAVQAAKAMRDWNRLSSRRLLQAFPRHSLSRAAIQSSGAPIFLLDAYTRITLFHCTSSSQQVGSHADPATSSATTSMCCMYGCIALSGRLHSAVRHDAAPGKNVRQSTHPVMHACLECFCRTKVTAQLSRVCAVDLQVSSPPLNTRLPW